MTHRARGAACSRPWRRSWASSSARSRRRLRSRTRRSRASGSPTQLQWDLTIRMLADIGFDFDAGRQDRSAHPFTTTIALHDIRLTTRIDEADPFSALSSTLHEAGHGLYDQGFDPEYEDTPIAQAPSLGLHESQSRLWENLVGRSLPFWRRYTPVMHEVFGDTMRRRDGRGRPSPGEPGHAVADPRRGRRGHLQHAHPRALRARAGAAARRARRRRPAGRLERRLPPPPRRRAAERRRGRAPGRALVVAGRSATSRRTRSATSTRPFCGTRSAADIPDVEARIEAGEFAPLLDWLRDRIHRPGYLEEGEDLITRVTGSGLTHEPFMRLPVGEVRRALRREQDRVDGGDGGHGDPRPRPLPRAGGDPQPVGARAAGGRPHARLPARPRARARRGRRRRADRLGHGEHPRRAAAVRRGSTACRSS